MQHNDVVLKEILQGAVRTMTLLSGSPVTRWLNVDMAQVKALRPDLVGERYSGGLFHLELMTKNEPNAPLRMLEYNLTIQLGYKLIPDQVLLYVGFDPMRMTDRIETPHLNFRFRLVDAKDLDGDALLESPDLGDNILAVLGRLRNQRSAVRDVLNRIGKCTPVDREKALTALMTLAGLRRLAGVVEEETKRMPLHIDILENEVLGREFRKGLSQGREEGLHEGERKLVLRQVEARFGPLDPLNAARLTALTPSQLEQVSLRILTCESIEELLP